MENEPTTTDVILILENYPDNLTARRWLKNYNAIEYILECHIAWNKDHEKIEPNMVVPLETNVVYYMEAAPSLIDDNI